MIASDDNRRFDFAAFDQFIHRDAELCTLAITEPADARGQPLKLDSLFRKFHPARKSLIFRKQVERERFLERHAVWYVPVQRIVRAGLISENIRNYAALYDFRQDIGAVADKTN